MSNIGIIAVKIGGIEKKNECIGCSDKRSFGKNNHNIFR